MEIQHYQQFLDKLFCNGNLWKHRTFRTVLDCGSSEWNQTTLEQKFSFIKKIEENYLEDTSSDFPYSFVDVIKEYRINYLEEKKQHVVNNLKETLDILYYYALDIDSLLAATIYDAMEYCKPKITFNPFTTRYPFADMYLNDVIRYPFHIILAILMEHKTKSNNIAHAIPYLVDENCVTHSYKGEPTTIAHLAKISQQTLIDLFEEKNLHTEEYALRFYHIVQYIHNYLDGDVSKLWENVSSKKELIENLLTLPYMYIDKAEKIFVLLNYCFKIIDLNDNNMNTPTQQFLLQSYFGSIKDSVNATIKRAYRDLNRTLTGIAKYENADAIKELWVNIITEFVEKVQLQNFPAQKDFDDLHREYCEKLKSINNDYMSIGQAQKWLNMTLKNLIVLEDELILRNKKYFHIPIDNIIQDFIEKEFGIKKAFPVWSKIEDYELYLDYQNEIRSMLTSTYPIDMEMVLFNDAIGKMEDNNMLGNWNEKITEWLTDDK